MSSTFAEFTALQEARHLNCGDFVQYSRTSSAFTLILCDGRGTGINARLSAVYTVSRFMELLKRGFSLREAFYSAVRNALRNKKKDGPYSVFSVIRVLNDGKGTVLNYEMPQPLFIPKYKSPYIPASKKIEIDKEKVSEVNFIADPGDSIVLMSDGVTHAGMGVSNSWGWGIENICRDVNVALRDNMSKEDIPGFIFKNASDLSGGKYRDDTSLVSVNIRNSNSLSLLAGELDFIKSKDFSLIKQFFALNSARVIAGLDNAYMAGKITGKRAYMESDNNCRVDGIDLVLKNNSAMNVIYSFDDHVPEEDTESCRLKALFDASDRIDFYIGHPRNSIIRGVLGGRDIIPILAEKLRKRGKIVTVNSIDRLRRNLI